MGSIHALRQAFVFFAITCEEAHVRTDPARFSHSLPALDERKVWKEVGWGGSGVQSEEREREKKGRGTPWWPWSWLRFRGEGSWLVITAVITVCMSQKPRCSEILFRYIGVFGICTRWVTCQMVRLRFYLVMYPGLYQIKTPGLWGRWAWQI